ncbi:MAG: hypothetical protein WBN18_11260 [Flavobacteriaceae bacterium]
MKKLMSLMAILAIVTASHCSRIPENNDPIIGIWENVELKAIGQTEKQTVAQEWIFNDAYLGRYHQRQNNELTIKTDFKWTEDKGVYTISYPGTDLPNQLVSMQQTSEGDMLKDNEGHVIAIRNAD